MHRLRRVDLQPLIDKAAGKLKAWWGRNLTQAGRLSLTKSVLSVQPVYLLTVINVNNEILGELDKLRKQFFWAGDQELTGGQCKVNWPTVGRPLKLGGLGVLDIKYFARALRMRWLWQEITDPDKPWIGLGTPCTKIDKLLSAACTTIHIGDGSDISFWHSAWADGQRPKNLAPKIYSASGRKNRTLQEAVQDHTWVMDLDVSKCLTLGQLTEFVALWIKVQNLHLTPGERDHVTWKFMPSNTSHRVDKDRPHTADLETVGASEMQDFFLAYHKK